MEKLKKKCGTFFEIPYTEMMGEKGLQLKK